MHRVAVLGLASAGQAVVSALARRGIGIVAADDALTDAQRAFAASHGARLVEDPSGSGIDEFLAGVDLVVPAPGVPPRHRALVAAGSAGVAVRSEIDLAYGWESERPGGPRPFLGVTGTDGKTTTTMLAAALLRGAGLNPAEAGNTDLPLVTAVDDPARDAFIVECSSFRLHHAVDFRCEAAVWLNLAPDHLDWHGDLAHYGAAKERIWAASRTSDVAVAPANDERILAAARRSVARTVTFGLDRGDYRCEGGRLVGPSGPICETGSLWRTMPHDIFDSLAAVAMVLEAGLVDPGSVAGPLGSFVPARHRIELVAERDGTRWFDDSKATSPHAALTAIRSLERIVLIAGGRNKGLDLADMAVEGARMHAVIAIGEDAPAIAAAFAGVCEVVTAGSMGSAVALAAGLCGPGIDVLLSPGCTSYDWYANYSERGDDFRRAVRALLEAGGVPG